MRIDKTIALLFLLVFGLACLLASPSGAQEDPDEGQINLIITFVSDEDRETRAVGLQFIREEVPGEAATKKFTALLPRLSPVAQVELLEALGDRQDVTARPAVLDMLKSEKDTVRAAALRSLGLLGSMADVPLLSGKAAKGSDIEKIAAQASLVKLKGDDVNAAILTEVEKGAPAVRVALLGVLAARNAKEALPVVLKGAGDSEGTVRVAALEALRFLAEEKDTEKVVATLKAAKSDAETRKAELALLGVCARGRETCVDPVIAGMADADARSRIALLHALARAGGDKALKAVLACRQDDDVTVRNEAMRMLSAWGDPAVVPHLLDIAKNNRTTRYQVLAMRGLVRLASPGKEKPADLESLGELMKLAKRLNEKRLVLGALSGADTQQALDMAMPIAGDPELAEEARFAVVLIAGKMKEEDKAAGTAALKKMFEDTKNPLVRVVAVQGLVRLASPKEKPADLAMLAETMKMAERPQEKEYVITALGRVGKAESLALVVPAIDEPKLAEEACLSAVLIGERMAEDNKDAGMKIADKDAVQAAMEKVLKKATNRQVLAKARKVLGSLKAL